MAVGVAEMKGLDWLGRIRVTWNMAGAAALILLGIPIGLALGFYTQDWGQWPYDVIERHIVKAEVEPGGMLAMQRLIDYHREDCWRQYDRRVVSRVKTGTRAGFVFRPEPVIEQSLPVDLSNKWQTWSVRLPTDFPCGPAYLVETVTAACTWWQINVRHLHKPDIITPFEVVGCGVGTP